MIVASVMVFAIGTIVYAVYMQNRRLTVDSASYAPVLHVIARAESNDNYNAYFGNAGNTAIDFTKMSISDVLKWQSDFIAKGNPSSAVGKYQLINTTLSGFVKRLGIDPSKKFDATMQDNLAIALLERRGSIKYVNAGLTRDQFAASLAKEWAGLPKVIGDNPGDSYYASDGINKSRVPVDQIQKAVEKITPKK